MAPFLLFFAGIKYFFKLLTEINLLIYLEILTYF